MGQQGISRKAGGISEMHTQTLSFLRAHLLCAHTKEKGSRFPALVDVSAVFFVCSSQPSSNMHGANADPPRGVLACRSPGKRVRWAKWTSLLFESPSQNALGPRRKPQRSRLHPPGRGAGGLFQGNSNKELFCSCCPEMGHKRLLFFFFAHIYVAHFLS